MIAFENGVHVINVISTCGAMAWVHDLNIYIIEMEKDFICNDRECKILFII